MRVACLTIVMWLPTSLVFAQGQGNSTRVVNPPDVHARVRLLQAELELVRQEMGRRRSESAVIRVEGASPPEVFFQAITLCHKADQLAFEQVRRRSPLPQAPANVEPEPRHVLAVVDQALKLIRAVKADLGCQEKVSEGKVDPTKKPSDVFNAIVEANRQLNLLLDRRFSPSDVYQRVTVAINYGSILLAGLPGPKRIPEAPDFVARKRPSDVFHRLVDCFESLRRVAVASKVSVLKLHFDAKQVDAIEPSDVYDMASLLVSELAQFHRLKGARPPLKAYYPGRKQPAHVFQRAGVLQAQLLELEMKVKSKPNWLRSN